MANPSGTNQFGGFGVQEPYGDKSRQAVLQRLVPLEGAPGAAAAIETPRRAKLATQRQGAGPQPEEAPPVPEPGPSLGAIFQAISRIPGVTPVWDQLPG